ncbi:sensor histidine kinase [Paenibacillus monticola]|uniref:HAMP domain-containing protein n=1 Tax=Paenibacillus monticola TaxID=2666075 RepID=A0A7X2HBE8_9BACL|nr:histidine kinase [Paenibacillus monticola]MRN56298.1 HAMP domain-containing protein [Paenibacillus monticola]
MAIKKQRFMPFTYKMMIPYLLLVLLTDVLIGYISYSMLTESRTEMAETNIRTGMEQARNNIRYQMDEIQRMSDTLFGSLPFQRALQKKGDRLDIYLTMLDEIVPQLKSPLQLFGNNIRFMLYTLNSDLNIVSGDNLEEPIKDSDYYILPFEDIADTEWYQALKDSERDNIWIQIDTDQLLGNISHIRRLVSFSDYKTVIGYVRITASLGDLLGGFSAFPVEDGVTLRLVDQKTGNPIYQSGTAEQGDTQDSYLSLHEKIPGSDFVIETLVPHTYLTRDAGKLQKVILGVCAISFIVMTFIGFIVARLSGRKMSRIVGLVRSFQEGNFQKRIRFSGNDEFVQIAAAFNVMAINIQELINSVYVQGIQKKQAELEALQAQINPHFLYNTLSTINSLANLGEIEKVTGMVQGLSRFYRLTLNQGNVYILLEKELEQVETYLEIQRVKYADAFTIYVDVDPDILDMQIIKLVLQPFVENVFKHAWFGETIAIRLTGKRIGDRIELKVIDNGIGMRPETVRKLMTGPTQAGGYGVKNVDERIKLRYGDAYGVNIASIYGAGTTVQLLFPADVRDRNDADESAT